ncbi:MAG: hypothetical protein ABSG89_02700 [Bacteroidales bacterium]|jgi:hypothetical protein
MKKLIIMPVALLAAFISCKKETPLDEAIVGEWDVTAYSEVYYSDNVKTYEDTYYLTGNEMAIEFTSSGTGIIYENSDVYGLFNWTISDNTMTVSGITPSTWNISIDKGILTWSYTTDSLTYTYDYIYTAKKSN